MESCGQPDLGHGGDHVMVLLDMQSFMGKHPGLLLVLCLKGCFGFRVATLPFSPSPAASVLSSSFSPTQAQGRGTTQISVTWNPPDPLEGQDVTLMAGGTLDKIVSCSWFRGRITDLAKRIFVYYLPPTTLGQINGVAYTGRETGAPDCSLHIRNLTLSDSGSYTVAKEGSVTAIGHVNIEIPAFLSRPPTEVLPKPSVSAFPGRFLIELTDSLHLKCNTTFKPMTISWFWNGGPLPSSSQFELSNHNRSLTTQRVNRSDMGDYQCQVSNPASTQRSDALKITVFCEYRFFLHSTCPVPAIIVFLGPQQPVPPVPPSSRSGERHHSGVAVEMNQGPLQEIQRKEDGPDPPEIQPAEKFYAEHSSFNLSCKATVFPEAEYRWFFNGKEEAKGPDLVIEDISLQQSGEYTCQAVNLVSHLESNTTLRIEVVPSKQP
ncbi:Carcinoembryonic antigen-related cell adhesion molecule 6 [Varanus komodoensis]|nr:Carcinoembryonic antigen-related cell adhesion molecule 6 [Varanus komodoensis]